MSTFSKKRRNTVQPGKVDLKAAAQKKLKLVTVEKNQALVIAVLVKTEWVISWSLMNIVMTQICKS